MRPAAVLGILLILLGALALVMKGFSFTRRETHDLGPIDVTTKETRRVPIEPVIAGLAIVAGVGLVLVGNRRSA